MARIRITEGCTVPGIGDFNVGDLVTHTPGTEFLLTQRKGILEADQVFDEPADLEEDL